MIEMAANPTARIRILPPRDSRGRFVARLCAGSNVNRVRRLPSRDARGRFVAFPTANAPSWYVFCADCYRIPGTAEVIPMALDAPHAPPPQPLPPARMVRRRRPLMRCDELLTWFLLALFVFVMGWYGLSLPVPHR